jgi:hypothetical protein
MKNIKNTTELREAIINGQNMFALALKFGMYSRKTIEIRPNGRFRVIHHIDGSKQSLTGRQLYTRSNIGKGMKMGALFPMPQL